MEELQKRIEELEKENKTLREMLNRGSARNTSAYNAIREMIIQKVQEEVDVSNLKEDWMVKDTRQKAERQMMSDLKWDIRVRNISDFRAEHIEPAREYIKNYILAEDLKKSRWAGA